LPAADGAAINLAGTGEKNLEHFRRDALNDIPRTDAALAGPGHNSQDIVFEIELRFFNALTRYARAGETRQKIQVTPGTTVGELARDLDIPRDKIFLALVNGRDITPGLVGAPLREGHMLEDRDVVAFSGAVPYSYGYGAPVV
jgi:hypothetical protein